ncbi:MAG: NUDIX domain-containing protein [Nanoarchaeota archaeon]
MSAGCIIINNGKVVVVSQPKNTYSFPNGHVEANKSILEGAYKEIYEETGLMKEDPALIKEFERYGRPDGKTRNPKDTQLFSFSLTPLRLK